MVKDRLKDQVSHTWSLDNVLQRQRMVIAIFYDILFNMQGIFGDKGSLARQVDLRTIMNIMFG